MKRPVKALATADSAQALEEMTGLLSGVGLEIDPVADPGRLPADRLPYRLIFVACRNVEGLAELEPRMRESAQLVVVVPDDTDLEAEVAFLSVENCHHVVKLGGSGGERLVATAKKLATGDIFGLEKYLPSGSEVKYLRLTESKGRGAAIDRIVDYAAGAKFRSAQRQHIAQVCEELLMNALYNAPVDEDGNVVFAGVEPKDRMTMATPRPVSVRFGGSGDVFGIAVRDRFGTLDKETFVGYLDKCLHSDVQMDRKKSGAGLGLYQVASRANEYVNNVAPGVATEAVALFDRRAVGERSLRTVGFFRHPGEGMPKGLSEEFGFSDSEPPGNDS